MAFSLLIRGFPFLLFKGEVGGEKEKEVAICRYGSVGDGIGYMKWKGQLAIACKGHFVKVVYVTSNFGSYGDFAVEVEMMNWICLQLGWKSAFFELTLASGCKGCTRS